MRVKVDQGPYRAAKMSRTPISAEEEAEGVVLACRLILEGDLPVDLIDEF